MYTLRFLGSARVCDSTASMGERLSQPQALALLACASTAGPHGCTRDKLVGLLWQDLDSRHARHALSVQLHQIRRVLGKDALLTEGDCVRLNPETVTADVVHFEDAVRSGDLRRAADLYKGPFLDGFHLSGCAGFERWMEDERQRLAELCLDLLESLAGHAEREGDLAQAVAWWQRAARHDPFNSRVALACARAHAASGDRGNGVQFLRNHVARLRTELEIEPDDEILTALRTGELGVTPRYAGGYGDASAADRSTSPATVPPLGGRSSLVSPVPAEIGDPNTASAGSVPPLADRRRRGSWHRRIPALAVVAVLIFGGTMVVRARNTGRYDPARIAVLPTQVVGRDTSIALLATSHLHASLADWRSLEIASHDAVMELWRAAGGTAGAAPAQAVARSVAARLGAGLLLTSRATPVTDGTELQASLVNAGDGALVAEARLAGPKDALRVTAQRLLIHLFADVERIPDDRVATLDAHNPDAVRSYVRSHRVGPVEREHLLRDALDRDSTFALAALELLHRVPWNAGRLREPAWASEAATLWTHRQRLSRGDRAYAEALVGWRFIPRYTAAQYVAAWEHAVEMAPDRLHNLRGHALACYRWCSQLNAGWTDRALEAQDALLEAGDTTPHLLEVGVEVAVLAGDRSRTQRYAGLLPERARYGRWLAAMALGSTREVTRLRRLIERGGFFDYRVGNVAVLTGFGLADAEMMARREKNSGRVYQLRADVQARERGRHAEHRALRDKMFQIKHMETYVDLFLSHHVVWEWAYFDEPEADSALDRHDRTFTEIIDRRPRVAPDTLATAHCALAQLRLGREDTTGVADAVAFLTHDPAARDLAVSRMCAPFLELLAVRGYGHDAITRAARRLNEIVRDRPLDMESGDGMVNVEIMLAGAANLELARTYLSLGYPEAGLKAVVRRPYLTGQWALFGFHIEFLLEEARLLAAAGATEQALAKYDLYFRLRPEPPDLDSWRETWEAARAEREALLTVDVPLFGD